MVQADAQSQALQFDVSTQTGEEMVALGGRRRKRIEITKGVIPVTFQEAMKQLKACGTEQNRKTWGRHGIKGEMFGVSFANLYKLQKQIKVDHELAEQLWATDNHDGFWRRSSPIRML